MTEMTTAAATRVEALLISGTLVSTDLQASRDFYENFFGLECVHPDGDTRRLLARQRGGTGPGRFVLDVRQVDEITHPQVLFHHWGFDVPSRAEVDRIHADAVRLKDRFGLRKIQNVRMQHGIYGFYLQDRDSNWWEVEEPAPISLPDIIARGDCMAE